jgi:hypothetical protein
LENGKHARRQAVMPQLQERLDRNVRIERKTQLLEQLHPECEAELEGTFANYVANAILASSSTRECQQEIDKATGTYEDALDSMLYEILDKHPADEDSSAA